MATAGFDKCSEDLVRILDNEEFGARDFWEGYKLYCYAYYSHCDTSKGLFQDCKMGRVLCTLHHTVQIAWGTRFDASIREVWGMMEEYAFIRHGKDCTNLRALMDEFDDVEELAKSQNGSLLIQLIKGDDHATEHLHTASQAIQLDTTDIFDEFRARLNQAQVHLANLSPQPRQSQRRNQ